MSQKLQLDQFLQDNTKFEIESPKLKKVFTGDVSSLTLMKVFNSLQDEKVANDLALSTEILFNTVFGKAQAKEIFTLFNIEGIKAISEKIGTFMKVDEGK